MRTNVLVRIDTDNIVKNLEYLRMKSAGAPVIAVVKADAYGHGAVEVARVLEDNGVYAFAVAYLSEAVQLRERGIKRPILVLFERLKFRDIVDYSLTPVISDIGTASAISKEAVSAGRTVDVHIDIDTGMGRIGFLFDRDKGLVEDVAKLDGVRIRGVMSHFSEADLNTREFASEQLKRFNEFRVSSKYLTQDAVWHISNSAATLSFKEARMAAVRPGLSLYGISPFGRDENLMPVMSVKTRCIDIRSIPKGRSISYGRTFTTSRDSLIGVLPVGYADGYFRLVSNRGYVSVRGERAPVVGRVCMDITLVDLTDIDGISIDDDIYLIGGKGDFRIGADELAEWSGTIPYEVLIALGTKNRRIFETGC